MESEIKITFKKIHLKSIANTVPSVNSSSGNVENRGRGPRKSYDYNSRTKKRRLYELRSK